MTTIPPVDGHSGPSDVPHQNEDANLPLTNVPANHVGQQQWQGPLKDNDYCPYCDLPGHRKEDCPRYWD